MDYTNIKCISSEKENCRYVLSKPGANNLIVIGFNPSTATAKESDRTMGKVLSIASYNGYDGFVMLNIYPLRSTKPQNLPQKCDAIICNKNLRLIEETLDSLRDADVLLAYGNLILKKPYGRIIRDRVIDILRGKKRKVLCIEKLKTGNPRHPLYARSATKLSPFEI